MMRFMSQGGQASKTMPFAAGINGDRGLGYPTTDNLSASVVSTAVCPVKKNECGKDSFAGSKGRLFSSLLNGGCSPVKCPVDGVFSCVEGGTKFCLTQIASAVIQTTERTLVGNTRGNAGQK